tara:strand:- start:10088 stop:11311 length:1224 start_codon:yes stop_codon:yes gene_type:complete
MLLRDLRADFRWLAGGFLLALSSGFGQTYFIAIFAGYLKSDLLLSDGQFGGLYTAGTLSSAALLIWAGKFADEFPIRWLGSGILCGLALAALGMASVSSALMLGLVFFSLRFFGQGMATHVAFTAMGRWFNRKRGRAVAIAALGLSAAEAALPLIAVALIALVGWRWTWVTIAATLAFVSAPLLVALLTRERTSADEPPAHADISVATPTGHDWTRSEVLRSGLFYALMPGLLAPPFIMTGIFFNQITIISLKGWDLTWFAASFPVLAGVNMVSGLVAGWIVDRVGARRLLPSFLIPLGLGTLLLTFASSPFAIPAFMALLGLTAGSMSTIQGAVWAEIYGTAHLGAIRALATSGMVFGSALSPGLIGVLLDAGVPLEAQLLVMGLYCFAASAWMAVLMPRLHRLTT